MSQEFVRENLVVDRELLAGLENYRELYIYVVENQIIIDSQQREALLNRPYFVLVRTNASTGLPSSKSNGKIQVKIQEKKIQVIYPGGLSKKSEEIRSVGYPLDKIKKYLRKVLPVEFVLT